MLVLNRKVGERIHIGEEIFIEVRQITGHRVSLALSAPQCIRILRGELFQPVDSSVLDNEHGTSESTIDTVIMRDAPGGTVTPVRPLPQQQN